jgi:hypothetical protein
VYVHDGLHRGEAARLAETLLLVEVKPGARQDAEWLALAANQKHGLRRSQKDKQRIIRNALRHPYGAKLSDREIGRHCGVDHKTVGKIRKELETTGEIPQLDKRLVVKASGETYELNTRNIGSQPDPRRSRQGDSRPIETHSARYPGRPVPWTSPAPEGQAGDPGGYEPQAQAFQCPRCGLEKIVGVNGSRRWCLNCGAEWPTATASLAEVEAQPPDRTERRRLESLQDRFTDLLVHLDEGELETVETWLNDLERHLAAAEKPVPGYAA